MRPQYGPQRLQPGLHLALWLVGCEKALAQDHALGRDDLMLRDVMRIRTEHRCPIPRAWSREGGIAVPETSQSAAAQNRDLGDDPIEKLLEADGGAVWWAFHDPPRQEICRCQFAVINVCFSCMLSRGLLYGKTRNPHLFPHSALFHLLAALQNVQVCRAWEGSA